jgi:hypothetical protein
VTLKLTKLNRKDFDNLKNRWLVSVSGIFMVGVRSNVDGRCNHVGMHKMLGLIPLPSETIIHYGPVNISMSIIFLISFRDYLK